MERVRGQQGDEWRCVRAKLKLVILTVDGDTPRDIYVGCPGLFFN